MSSQEPHGLFARARDARLLQVLGVYLAVSFGAIQIIDIFIDRLGLPDWFFPAAIALLVIGVPIMVATAVLQSSHSRSAPREILPGFESNELRADDVSPPAGGQHWLTWRRALLGGAGAFALLVLVAVGYLGLRAAGIGPVGSLLAKGVLKQNDRILIADFHSSPVDSLWAQAVTEAFRVDFAQTRAVTVVGPDRVRDALRQMMKPPDTHLDAATAREVALRAGISAVVTGDIARAGGGYVVSAHLIAPDSGTVLAAYREEAADSAGLLPAIDKLSKKLRGKIGESLRAIRANDRLEQVTTPSLEALRKYSMAIRPVPRAPHGARAVPDGSGVFQYPPPVPERDRGVPAAPRSLPQRLHSAQQSGVALPVRSRLSARRRSSQESHQCGVRLAGRISQSAANTGRHGRPGRCAADRGADAHPLSRERFPRCSPRRLVQLARTI